MELTFFFLTVTREHVLKMNVVLIKECTRLLTQNAFSVDHDRD